MDIKLYKKNKLFTFIFCGLGAITIFTIIIPILKIIFDVNLLDLKKTILDNEVASTILLSLKASFYASIAGFISGVPLAYILARTNFKGKIIIESIIDLPIIIPHAAVGIALLSVVGKGFFIGKLFHKLGIGFIGTEYGITLAMFFVSVPFLINTAKEGFKMVDPQLEHAAILLGANKFRAFWDITLPLSIRSIFSGMIMMWTRGISEFGAIIILAYHPMVVSIKIFERFEAYGLAYAKPIAVLLILLSLLIFLILRLLLKKDKIYD
ncbi:MAG: ABC transporter permease [Bacteroidetes bacterium]|nr:ABC transporter permease [Bacteroidota bacterium]